MRKADWYLIPVLTMRADTHRIDADLSRARDEGFKIKPNGIAPQCSSTMKSCAEVLVTNYHQLITFTLLLLFTEMALF